MHGWSSVLLIKFAVISPVDIPWPFYCPRVSEDSWGCAQWSILDELWDVWFRDVTLCRVCDETSRTICSPGCLVPVRRLPRPFRSMHLVTYRERPRQSGSTHALPIILNKAIWRSFVRQISREKWCQTGSFLLDIQKHHVARGWKNISYPLSSISCLCR